MLDHISNLGRRHFTTLSAAAGASFLLNGRDSRAAPVAGTPVAGTPVAAAPIAAIEKPGKTPNTRFAVNVEMWFRGKSFLEKIHAADELGYPAIEFWPYEGKPIDKAAKLLKEKNIAVSQFTAWGFGTELNNPKSDHERFVKTIQESCDVADRSDCHLLTVVIGNDIQGVSKDAMHAAAIAGLKRAAPICEKRGKTIIIEPMNPRNHPAHCLYGSRDAINICKAVGSEAVKINWDLYHMQIVEGDLTMTMREGWDYIGYLQLADNPGRNEPGTGEVNYTRVFEEIKKLKYDGYVGLECNPKEGDLIAARRIYAADSF